MWKLKEIYAQNICAFRQLHYHPKQNVTTLIFGDNRDNDSQRSNGSGKSALIECIALGITGNTLRKVKNEEIINDESDECLIELTFFNEAISEQLVIERKLYRKGTTEVNCYIFRNGSFEAEEAIQPSIEAYNKYILETLGITKDELFNNFILSKHKYQDFLSCPDKDKKEIINRFSNGIMVDQAIEEILKDKKPVEEQLRKTEIEFAGIEGRRTAMEDQIREEENNEQLNNKTKEEKISKLRDCISEKKEHIRVKSDCLGKLETQTIAIQEVDNQIQILENSQNNLEGYLSGINSLIPIISIQPLSNWGATIATKKATIKETEKELAIVNAELELSEKEVDALNRSHIKLKNEFEQFIGECNDRAETYSNELLRLNNEHTGILIGIERLKASKINLSTSIESLNNKLAGVISCPSCGFEFIVSDKSFNVDQGREDKKDIEDNLRAVETRIDKLRCNLAESENKQNEIEKKSRAIESENISWTEKILLAEGLLRAASVKMQNTAALQKNIFDKINQLHSDLDGILKKAFDEAYEFINDARQRNERNKNAVNEEIQACISSIETLEHSVRELEGTTARTIMDSLVRSLGETYEKSMVVFSKKSRLEQELLLLERQEQNFIEFKTYLANSKIDALASVTNEFLSDIGSDIRVKLSGYTKLKSGKVRDKISVSIIRSGLDCGSFGKFSAGESARVNLATILAMQKLINANCNNDKGLDLLVLDEILEAVDEQGLDFMFGALNKLKITAMVVSHGNIAESYPHVVRIIKEHGESKIDTEHPY